MVSHMTHKSHVKFMPCSMVLCGEVGEEGDGETTFIDQRHTVKKGREVNREPNRFCLRCGTSEDEEEGCNKTGGRRRTDGRTDDP